MSMTTATLIRQLRILEIIIICYLAATLEGRSLQSQPDKIIEKQNNRVKRGYSHYGQNDFGSAAHVSSAVLQYSTGDEYSGILDSSKHLDTAAISDEHSVSLDASNHFDTSSASVGHSGSLDSISHLDASDSNTDPWSASGPSSGYEVWLEPLPNYHGSSGLDSSSHTDSAHIANTVLSGGAAHYELPISQLHTQISSSIIGSNISAADTGDSTHDHGSVAISDNIDFNNVADIKSKHYAKSYGK